jgi:hypothetical protein
MAGGWPTATGFRSGEKAPLRFVPDREGRYLFLGQALGPASSSLVFGRMLRPRIRAELTSSADARWLLNLFLPTFLGRRRIAMADFSFNELGSEGKR